MPEPRDPDFDLYFRVLRVLEQTGARYAIIGAFGALAFGLDRVTMDIDIVVDLTEEGIQALVDSFPSPRYYADPYQMRDSIRVGIMFNIIDSSLALKADLMPVTMHPTEYRNVLRNRVRRTISAASEPLDVWFANPADIIIGKLMAWAEGRSHKHENDIFTMLTFQYIPHKDPIPFDEARIEAAARAFGPEVLAFWHAAQEAAHRQAEGGEQKS